jgi:hypothetical protein
LINHRINGDTLASKERLAMTPTVQPVAAGTHRYRELDRLPERGLEAGEASVTDREDIPSTRGMPDEAPIVVETSYPRAARDHAGQAAVPVVAHWLKCLKTPDGW